MHWLSFLFAKRSSGEKPVARRELDPQGDVLSERRTPFSRASCSRVMGMKEPTEQTLALKRQDMAFDLDVS